MKVEEQKDNKRWLCRFWRWMRGLETNALRAGIQYLNHLTVKGLNKQVGQKVIIRTYSAGVWFGVLAEKSGNEVYLKDARRMYRWWAAESFSLSGVARYGIKQDKSKICPAVDIVWLEAIEILTLTDKCIESIETCPDAVAE